MPPADTALAESIAPVESGVAERAGSSRSDCTDCSHCAGRSKLRTRAGVRVSINLGQYFSDHRARAFMWAPSGRCVQWLSRRIARVFGLTDTIALISRGHMLPISEPLLMLEHDEPIQVVHVSNMSSPHEKFDENVTNHRHTNDISALTGHMGTNVKVHLTLCNESTKPNLSQSLGSRQCNNIAEHQDTSGLEHPTEDMETTIRSVESQSLTENEDLQRVKQQALRFLDEHYLKQGGSAPKRMRRRRRRRRPLLEAPLASAASDEDEAQNCNTTVVSQDVYAAVLRNGSGSRPPRLIHALSPSPVLQDA